MAAQESLERLVDGGKAFLRRRRMQACGGSNSVVSVLLVFLCDCVGAWSDCGEKRGYESICSDVMVLRRLDGRSGGRAYHTYGTIYIIICTTYELSSSSVPAANCLRAAMPEQYSTIGKEQIHFCVKIKSWNNLEIYLSIA